jgi:hypothetical protein
MALGVPKLGVVSVGLVDRTVLPVPVLVVVPVPPLRTARVPVTPVDRGRPVTLVITPEAGVPRAGVVSVGLVRVLFVSVCGRVTITTVSVLAVVEEPKSGRLAVWVPEVWVELDAKLTAPPVDRRNCAATSSESVPYNFIQIFLSRLLE